MLVARCLPLALLIGAAHADTLILPAIDFPVRDAGDVPYYVDAARDALAIDAAVLAYRDRPARATMPFEGDGGFYDITLDVLAEIDGETTYRVLVDGAVVGSATNAPVALEFAERSHVFEAVEIPVGAVIAVESSAVSNGQIPENGEFAFARGRWTALMLESVGDDATTDVSTDIAIDPPTAGELVVVTEPDVGPMPEPAPDAGSRASDEAVRTGTSGSGAFGVAALGVLTVLIGWRRSVEKRPHG